MNTSKQKVFCGADVVASDGLDLQGKCGLITNHTGVLRDLSSTVDMLRERCNLTALLGPEHGVRGDIQANENVSFYIDKKTNTATDYRIRVEQKDVQKLKKVLEQKRQKMQEQSVVHRV